MGKSMEAKSDRRSRSRESKRTELRLRGGRFLALKSFQLATKATIRSFNPVFLQNKHGKSSRLAINIYTLQVTTAVKTAPLFTYISSM